MPSLSEHITQYLHACEFEKRLSDDTLKAYRIDLTQFAAFAQGSVVDKALLGEYAAHLNQHFAPRVLELLFDTGMRVSELCKLTPDTFQIGSNGLKLLIHGKGRKERVLQVATTEVVSLAEQYLGEFREGIYDTGYILLNRRGRPLAASRPSWRSGTRETR